MAQLQGLARAAGVEPSSGPDMSQVLKNFDPLLRGIAAVARGDDSGRGEIEGMLPELEENGWQLTDAVRRIWAGERDAAALTADVDPNSARLVERVLDLIELPSREEVLAGLPEAVREAIAAGDGEALRAAIEGLSEEEAAAVVEQLKAAGWIGKGGTG